MQITSIDLWCGNWQLLYSYVSIEKIMYFFLENFFRKMWIPFFDFVPIPLCILEFFYHTIESFARLRSEK